MRKRALWRVGPYLRPYARQIIFVALASVVTIGAQLAIPLIAKAIIDGPIRTHHRAGVWPLAGLALGLACIEVVLNYYRRLGLAKVATGMETGLRDDLYAKLQQLDVGFHDQWQSGQLLSRHR